MTQTAHRERGTAAPQERLPGDGELVEVRGQSWVVARVEPAPPADGGRTATLVHLQSVADGRFGDTLSVIWEVEPGRRILDRGSLPDASTGQYDPPSRLAAFLDAVRWSAVASADVKTLQAPFRSGVAVEPYQLEPVSRAVGAPRVNLLLADDVGLGKTIEAGLVVQELLLRGRAHRVMVICPAGLTLKWRDELAEKFGLEFTIVDAEHCARLRRTHGTAANPFRVHPLTIVSLPWLRGTKAQRLLDEVVPPRHETREDGTERRFFDLLVLDEAHHVAPAAPKQVYAVDSQQTKLIRRLVPHFEHRLFLSATPHNGYPESYTALLELIDNQKFARGVDPDEQARKETVVRRLKSTITNPDGSPHFRTRRTRELPVEYTDTEREIHGVLSSFADLRRKRMTPKARGGRRAADLVTLLLKKRLFSSPAAFLHTVQVYLSHLDDTRTRTRSAAADVPDWLEDFPDLVAELDDLGLAEAEDDALTRSTSLTPQEDGEELALLQRMERWALTHEAAADSKADALIRELKAICRPDGQFWTNERVVVFTEYRDTQKWLLNLLQQEELTDGGRVAVLHGGLSTDDREDIRLGFQAHPATDEGKVRILLATDAASEGIDLQNHCHRLFNYDIPFNPNKLEQRIGRIDRWGQKTDPEITHFIGAGWEKAAAGSYEADLEFLSRIARKIARTEADLGSVNAVIADAVQSRMTGDTTPVDIDNAKPKQIAGRRTGGTVAPEQNVTAQARRLAEQYRETVDTLGLTPANIKRVVDTALALDHQQPLTPHYNEDLDGLWTVPPLSGTWERATRGLAHKLRPAEQRPVTFDPQVAALGRDDVVLTHLKHPLVALSTRLLTAAVWNADTVGLYRVTAVVTDDPAVETALVSAYARYVLVGNDGTRLHEEILYAGGWFGDTGRFRRWESVRTQGAVLARALTDGTEAAPDLCRAYAEAWPRLEKPLHDSLNARARERGASLESALATRHTEEENRIQATLDRFEATLRAKLKEEGDDANEQIALFGTREVTTAEQRQYREDRERWQDRIEGLGAERDRELAAIVARYREPSSHLFPVAVVFVIPAKEASR
ncbi:DISARM system SNF2-like helicase DrmD [Streptomyces wuyuanensis]|uniref:DISARM system SNF2-like helicase DrmD n=1 Tax=Streptomyces wuyuanensis TaxID=1196353 RepID=UPI003D744B85